LRAFKRHVIDDQPPTRQTSFIGAGKWNVTFPVAAAGRHRLGPKHGGARDIVEGYQRAGAILWSLPSLLIKSVFPPVSLGEKKLND
jgi:hypothetical protein